MFKLKVLGSVSVRRAGEPHEMVPLQKRRLELVALLAVAGTDGIARKRIQTFFWPEGSRESARHALEQLIYATKRQLHPDVIRSQGGLLRLDPRVMDADVWSFAAAIREARWADAVALYAGPLLQGFALEGGWEVEHWVDQERLRLQTDHHRALEALARGATAKGNTAEALARWLDLSAWDPLAARVAADVVRAYAAAGNPMAGVRHARKFQDQVRAELGIEPTIEIEELALRMSVAPMPDLASAPQSESVAIAASESSAGAADAMADATPSRAMVGRKLVRTGVAIAAALVVAGALAGSDGHLTSTAEVRSAKRAAEIDPAAQEAYLRGLTAWNERSKSGLDTAVIEFRRALEREPAYADAYAGLARAYVLLGYSGYRPVEAMFPKARAAALRAIELDSNLAPAYAALGFVETGERRYPSAERAFQRALALDAADATAHQWYGIFLNITGRLPDAVRQTGIAAQLDPLSLQIQNTHATFLNAAGEHAAALRHYERFVAEEPDSAWIRRNPWLLSNMSRVYAANGRYADALRMVARALVILPTHPRLLWDLASIHLRMGRPDLAERDFAGADTTNEHYLAYRGFVYAQSGRLDSAFATFDRVRHWGMPLVIALRSNPDLAPVRQDARYPALLRRLGLVAP